MTDELHPTQILEGVGPASAKQLANAGVAWAEDLFFAEELRLKQVLVAAGFPLSKLSRLRLMAEFLQVPGVDHQFADPCIEQR